MKDFIEKLKERLRERIRERESAFLCSGFPFSDCNGRPIRGEVEINVNKLLKEIDEFAAEFQAGKEKA